ncbi:hypothetical protein [Vibrio neptunius]|uniref:Uncharacterized protein n=1 Tax=Vibrio neptunius TaxID=170651 RepID=A0ABS3A894_9VIBR|nr:hypothetical protein [Vibrio neptunius]MBN3495864.1 hypothetical protein [Vibrio neptunius]MBN3518314.1 hypothetical protein [Vibrio neptunius]MBN3552656.1 hypothetical protein [Vibrio neptunius]MBN3580706.1 hypothetical protein [Vibrio neptunius]MCH9874372.1 hypothetical protein [Vibrio neptunius]
MSMLAEEKLTEIFKLLLIILTPPLLSVCGISLVLGLASFRLDASKGLLSQGLLWLAMLLPISYFFVFGIIAWDGYNLDISSSGLSVFFEISAVPLTFLSLALPLTILVARFHSTEQTAKQIAITSHKNNLDSFYAHRKELFSYFAQLDETDYFGVFKVKYRVHPRLHKNFFVGSPDSGVPEINLDMFKSLEQTLSSARFQIDSVLTNKDPNSAFNFYMLNACVTIHYLSHTLGLKEIYGDLASRGVLLELDVKGKGKHEFLSVGTTTDDLVAAYRYAHDYYLNLCDFAGYVPEPIEEKYKYITTGGKFSTISTPKVIEQLHKNEIANLLKKQA